MKQYFLILFSVFLVFFSSCKEKSIAPINLELEKDFYPLEVDRTWVYLTDSVVFNKQLSTVDTLKGFVKETITDKFVTTGDIDLYIIERSFKRSLADQWSVTDIYSASFIDNKATRTEENLRFVKLVIPISLGQKWDGNQFFDESIIVNVGGESIEVYKNWDSEVTAIESIVNIYGVQYENCTEIILADSENSIEKRYVKEIYSKGVGLISKEMVVLCTQNSDTSIEILDRAEEGFVLSQSLVEYY